MIYTEIGVYTVNKAVLHRKIPQSSGDKSGIAPFEV